jgi:hypothetical protein
MRENQRMGNGKPALIAAAVLFGGLALSVIFFSADLPFLGMVAGFTAIPAAFVTWVMAGDRYY